MSTDLEPSDSNARWIGVVLSAFYLLDGRVRILKLCYEFPPVGGGAGKVVAGLAKALVGMGHQVDVVTGGFGNRPASERIGGVRVLRVPCTRTRAHYCTLPEALSYLLAAGPVARKLARSSTYDINHTHFILPDGLTAYRIRQDTGLPYLITAHGTDVPGYNPHRVRLAHRVARPIWNNVVNGASSIVCPSGMLRGLVERRNGSVPITQIPNAIDVSRFSYARGMPGRILTVSRILERKGVQYLLRALHDIQVPCTVDIVGDGPYLEKLRRIASDLGISARFWGWLAADSPDLRRLYEECSIFALPSDLENFPVALLEAMAAGLAVITTRNEGCAEVVGDAAFLVDPGDVRAIRMALQALITDRDRAIALGLSARARVESRFNWPYVAGRYVDLYEHCLDARRTESGQRTDVESAEPVLQYQ